MMQEWFKDAKFGIFITWGIYSRGMTSESWDMFNGVVPRDEYLAQAQEFTAADYDPKAWAELFRDSGARYAVLTTKHHDGFALWDSRASNWNAADASPAGRDLVGPYAEALREVGLRVGLYFSHSDWVHPDYATVMPKHVEEVAVVQAMRSNAFGFPQNGEDPEAWQRFVEFHRAQLKELCVRYAPDMLWFDGDWERDDEQWGFERLRNDLQAWAPGVVVNGRMGAYGDYSTPEQALPILQPPGVWEFCCTINDNWGYRASDKNFKTPQQCLELLIETVSLGGNLLLDIGPTETGEILPVYADTLRYIGNWLKVHGEAVYRSRAGLPFGHFWGPSTLSQDGKTLYLFVTGSRQQISVRGLFNKVKSVTVLGHEDQPLDHVSRGGAWWVPLPGFLWIDIKPELMDPHVSVLKVELEEPVQLYRGLGDKIMHNA